MWRQPPRLACPERSEGSSDSSTRLLDWLPVKTKASGLRPEDSRGRLSPQGHASWPLIQRCAGSQNSTGLSAILLEGHGSNWQAADGLAVIAFFLNSDWKS